MQGAGAAQSCKMDQAKAVKWNRLFAPMRRVQTWLMTCESFIESRTSSCRAFLMRGFEITYISPCKGPRKREEEEEEEQEEERDARGN